MKYYIKSKGKIFGPAEENKIKYYVLSGFFNLNSLVSTDLKDWLPLQECIVISTEERNSPPHIQEVQNDEDKQDQKIYRLTENNIVEKERYASNSKQTQPRKKILLASCAMILMLFLAVGGCTFFLYFNTIKTVWSSRGFQRVCQKYQSAVGVVTVTLETADGKLLSRFGDFTVSPEHPLGTAFAIGKNQFATNCHVAYRIKDQKTGVLEDILWTAVFSAAKQDGIQTEQELEQYVKKNKQDIENARTFLHNNVRVRSVEIRMAHSGERAISVTGVQIHPRYRTSPEDGWEFKNGEFDVAILTTAENVKNPFSIAAKKTLYALVPGQEIAYIGFPMEGLHDNGNIDLNRPEAVFKQGTINKITDFNNVFSAPEFNKSIIHDIPAVGGASGSPIFLSSGEVVAILWGVTHTGMNERGRIASAAQHNMAVRIDSLDIVRAQKVYDIKEWLGEQK